MSAGLLVRAHNGTAIVNILGIGLRYDSFLKLLKGLIDKPWV